ncbi:MAG TPA: hypothetical protein VFM88_08345, partial [Vicinamibacteria bacterium]|nr:hypothetical protein [Vicinamibacteria bacterium]
SPADSRFIILSRATGGPVFPDAKQLAVTTGRFQPRADVDLAVDAPGLSALEWLRLSDIAEDV